MRYSKEYTMKNGDQILIRTAELADAEELANCVNRVHDETEFLAFSSSEKSYTKDQELAKIQEMLDDDMSNLIVAVYDGKIVGSASISAVSKKKRIKHRSDMAVSILKEFWGFGIGGKLIESIIEIAKMIGYEQIELIVVADNFKAHNLYKSFGFEDFGVYPRGFKYSSNRYVDEYFMVKFLSKEQDGI